METPMQALGARRCALPDRSAGVACDLHTLDPRSGGHLEMRETIDDGGRDGRELLLPDSGEECQYLLILQIEGRCLVQQARTNALIEAGDMLLLDTGLAARLKVFGRSRQLCLALPYPPLHPQQSVRYPPPVGTISGAGGIGVALRSLLLAMHGITGAVTTREQRGLRAAVLDLALAALNAEAANGQSRMPRDGARRRLAPMQDTIENWLADPGLCPARVAAAHGISTRQLHRLFRQVGTSFSEFVRQRRLERCRDDLADPRLRTVPMTEIAFRWGFSDSSHFSRCFRAAFGCTARDFRAGQRLRIAAAEART